MEWRGDYDSGTKDGVSARTDNEHGKKRKKIAGREGQRNKGIEG
jgi:hypothetical protein